MFRKTLAATLTVATLATSTITAPTTASAANGRNFAAAVAFVAGAAIASAVASRPTYASSDRGYGYGGRCFEKEFVRFNGYGEKVITYKTFCR